MKYQKSTICTFLFLSFLFGNIQIGNAQIKKIGLLPSHIKIIKKTDERSKVWNKKSDAANLEEEGNEKYEKKYLKLFEKHIKAGFKLREVKIKTLKRKEMTQEEIDKEEELYEVIWKEVANYEMEIDRSYSKTDEEKKMKQTGELTEPLTTFFSEKLDRKLLLVTQIRGHHTRKKFEEKKNAPLAKDPRGNITIYGLIIDANTGKIVDHVVVKMSSSDTKFTESKIKRVAEKYARDVSRIDLEK